MDLSLKYTDLAEKNDNLKYISSLLYFMDNKILSLAAMENLLKKSGAPRVSEDAKEALRELLEDYAEKIGEKAVKIALHSGRKTVKAGDVKLAPK